MRRLTSFCKINYSVPISLASYLVTPVFLNYDQSLSIYQSIDCHPAANVRATFRDIAKAFDKA